MAQVDSGDGEGQSCPVAVELAGALQIALRELRFSRFWQNAPDEISIHEAKGVLQEAEQLIDSVNERFMAYHAHVTEHHCPGISALGAASANTPTQN
jgi:hypothetical protein